jgi:hypothetical protein
MTIKTPPPSAPPLSSLVSLLGNWDALPYCYLLIDNSAFDGAWLNEQGQRTLSYDAPLIAWLKHYAYPWDTVIGDATVPKEAACVPLLIQITSPYKLNLLFQQLTKTQEARSGLLCLVSQNSLPELRQRLRQRCDMTVGQNRCVLAYFDVNLWEECLEVLNDEQRQTFLSTASRWIWFNRDNELCYFDAEPTSNDPVNYRLILSDEQQDNILRVGEADRVGRYLSQYYETEGWRQDLTPRLRYEWLKERLLQARTFSLSSIPDLAAFCGLCLEHGDKFPDTEAGQALLAQVKSQQQSLTQLLESSL